MFHSVSAHRTCATVQICRTSGWPRSSPEFTEKRSLESLMQTCWTGSLTATGALAPHLGADLPELPPVSRGTYSATTSYNIGPQHGLQWLFLRCFVGPRNYPRNSPRNSPRVGPRHDRGILRMSVLCVTVALSGRPRTPAEFSADSPPTQNSTSLPPYPKRPVITLARRGQNPLDRNSPREAKPPI